MIAVGTAWDNFKEHSTEFAGKSRPIIETSREIVKLCERLVQDLENARPLFNASSDGALKANSNV